MRYQPGFRLQLLLGGALLATTISPAFAKGIAAEEPAKAADG